MCNQEGLLRFDNDDSLFSLPRMLVIIIGYIGLADSLSALRRTLDLQGVPFMPKHIDHDGEEWRNTFDYTLFQLTFLPYKLLSSAFSVTNFSPAIWKPLP